MYPEVWLPYSQGFSTDVFPEQDESVLHAHILFV
jgi:hypothetical protein